MKPLDYLTATLVVGIWGLNFIVVKLGTGELPPFLLTGLRFALAGLLMAPFFRPQKGQLPAILAVSFLMGVMHFGLLFFGIGGMEAATAAITIQLSAPFSALMASIFFSDHLGWRRGLAMLLAFLGVGLLVGEPTPPPAIPLLAVVVSALAWAYAQVVVKKAGPIAPLTLNAGMSLFAAPMLLALSLAVEDGQVQAMAQAGWAGWGAVVFTALLASITAYTLWYRLISRYDMNQVVPFTLLGPVIGVAGGVLLLDEALTWHKMVGGALTLIGVAVIQSRTARRHPAASAVKENPTE